MSETPIPAGFLADIARHVGCAVTLVYPDPLFPEAPPLFQQGTIVAAPEQHGWITPGGGWASMRCRPEDKPSWRFGFRRKGRRKKFWLRADDLLAVDYGAIGGRSFARAAPEALQRIAEAEK